MTAPRWLHDAGIEDPGPIRGDPDCPHTAADPLKWGGFDIWRCTVCRLIFRAELELIYGEPGGPTVEWLDLEPIGLTR